MKLSKKIKKNILFILTTVIIIQPLLLQFQLNSSQNYYKQQILPKEDATTIKDDRSKINYEIKNFVCDFDSSYIDISPSKLEGLNLREVFCLVIEHMYEKNIMHELPQGLLNCYEAVENDASSLYILDLAEALPVVIEKMMDPMIFPRASRPDAADFGDGSIVGPLLECNIDKAVRLLNQLLKVVNECCAALEFDFSGVFTTLSNLIASATCDFTSVFSIVNTNINGTFTELNDIKDTLTTCCNQLESDFDGTFTALANLVATASCDFTAVFSQLTMDFNGTFSVLDDIKNSLTLCCDQLESDFEGTFTALASLIISVSCDITSLFTLSTDFAGVFTVLNDIKNSQTICCDQLEFDFAGTFSLLANLVATVTCTLNSTFTVSTDFAGTFTVLNDIKNSQTLCCNQLEFNFDGTFTELARLAANLGCDFTSVLTAINGDFAGTFSTISDIKGTLTTCCTQLALDFDGTFTTLAHLVVTATCDLTSIFTVLHDIDTTLTTCCAQLALGFDGTFTALTNLMVTVSCDFASIFTSLQDIKNTLTACCINFNNTFTVLNDIRNTLTTCCATLESNFDGTFTVIEHLITTVSCDFKPVFTALNDIKNTLTICCDTLESNFDGTFTAIAHLVLTATVDLTLVFTSLNDIKNTLTVCCATAEHNFDATFTVLTDIRNSITTIDFSGTFTVFNVLIAGDCNPTVITQASFGVGGTVPLVISVPGVYILGENITFNPGAAARAITITTSAVTLDLQCFALQQGNSTAGVDAIRVNSGLADITIKNGMVTNFTRAGITIQNNNQRTKIQDLTCLSCAVRGIELLGTVGNVIKDAEIDHCNINGCSQGAAGDFAVLIQQSVSCSISYCDIKNCGSLGHALSTIRVDTCDETDINAVTIFNNSGSTLLGIQLLAPTRSSFENCLISSNTATANLTGIDMSGAANRFNKFDKCKILSNIAGASFVGISLAANTSNNIFVNCNLSWNSGGSATGIDLSGAGTNNNQNIFNYCLISTNMATTTNCNGFNVNGSDAGLIFKTIVLYNVAPNGQSAGVNFAAPNGGSNWVIKENLTLRNTGVNPASSFGYLITGSAINFITGNLSFNNGGVGALPANQLNGVPAGSIFTPAAPATSNLLTTGAPGFWPNVAIAV
jgi:hypothetical protein